ncbi:Heat shock factor protein [Paramyrothecium foliicola]|nr:Heat shock factor protein [Paramyrothecium foliicola]
MSAPGSRKRPAPGASPIVPIQQPMQQPYAPANVGADQIMRWNGAADTTGFVDNSTSAANSFGLMPAQPSYSQNAVAPSNSLTRRQPNHALVQTNPRQAFDTAVEPWMGLGDDGSLLQQGTGENLTEQDNVELLEEMAQKAKRDAQGKRKQIPPFVQKLSSFLEERKNEDLIRWSEKGDSFIVLDEDEFAKTLIPELFKHNNYASFVRQLNMYGFHKRVGLSDNSMRASERKNKSPSEYSNPFFRRGHPNLLWLINKPKSGKQNKKGAKNPDGDQDSEEEAVHDEIPNHGISTSNIPTGRSLPAPESQPLQRKEMAVIREELGSLREQQKLILNAINRLQRNNNDLYNQALMFQSQHDRHQNSINAILNFLANVFRKTLEEQGNSQNVGDIISSMITNQGQQQPHQGSVVDLGDFIQSQLDPNTGVGGLQKRTRGLLPPIPEQGSKTPSTRASSFGNTSYHGISSHNPEMGHVTELLDTPPAETPPSLRQELEKNPQERMMKIINDHNATNSSGLDLPEAAELVANAPNALSHDQRNKLVNFMAAQSSAGSTPSIPATSAPAVNMPSMSPPTSASPPSADMHAPPSLSPIMRSPQMPPPSLHQISANQLDLDQLQRLQSEQDAKISELGELLGPLSPNGRIPGLEDTNDTYFDPPNVDLEQYFDSDAFLHDGAFGGDGNDFNFNLDADGNVLPQEPQASKAGSKINTPSPATTEEIQRYDLGFPPAGQDRGGKRRRVD